MADPIYQCGNCGNALRFYYITDNISQELHFEQGEAGHIYVSEIRYARNRPATTNVFCGDCVKLVGTFEALPYPELR